MIRIGLASTAMMNSNPETVIETARIAGFQGIEWSADVHVAHGCLKDAERIMMSTLRSGLTVIAYGSYFRILGPDGYNNSFSSVLETARVLQAPIIRIWAGGASSSSLEGDMRLSFLDRSRRIGDDAAKFGITVCCEIHKNTFFDSYESTAALLAEIGHPFVKAAWSPIPGKASSWKAGMEELASETWIMRAFAWDASGERHPLQAQNGLLSPCVSAYCRGFRKSSMDRFIVVPWVKNDSPENMKIDADTLKDWLRDK